MMNMPQGMPTRPVPQNPVPPGAMPEEVADDVDIKASKGEYIIPADVVRFLGLEKIESLVDKAKESLAQLNQKGRIGGKPMPPQAPPAGPPPDMPVEGLGGPPQPVGMAQGGVVAPGGTSASMAAYEGPDGRVVYIPMINGQPITPIPAGYKPISRGQQPQVQRPQRERSSGSREFMNQDSQLQNRPSTPDQWSVDEFINYGKRLESGVPDALMGAIGSVLPIVNIFSGLADRNMQNTVPSMIDAMIENGVDSQGNPITEEQRTGLLNTKEVMADRMSRETGTRFNPFESLTNFVSRIAGGGRDRNGEQASNSLSNPTSSNSGSGSSSMSISGQLTAAPDKEEKAAPMKFSYGGLVSAKPKQGFMKK